MPEAGGLRALDFEFVFWEGAAATLLVHTEGKGGFFAAVSSNYFYIRFEPLEPVCFVAAESHFSWGPSLRLRANLNRIDFSSR